MKGVTTVGIKRGTLDTRIIIINIFGKENDKIWVWSYEFDKPKRMYISLVIERYYCGFRLLLAYDSEHYSSVLLDLLASAAASFPMTFNPLSSVILSITPRSSNSLLSSSACDAAILSALS